MPLEKCLDFKGFPQYADVEPAKTTTIAGRNLPHLKFEEVQKTACRIPNNPIENSTEKGYVRGMFTSRNIKDKLNAQPFKPFRLRMSNGVNYDIPNHDAAWVAAGAVVVGTNLNADGFAENYASCAILHIASIEDLQPA